MIKIIPEVKRNFNEDFNEKGSYTQLIYPN